MLQNLAVGTVLVVLTVLIHTVGLISIAALTPRVARWLRLHSHDFGRTLVMTGTVVGLLAVLTLEVWSWAVAYHLLGVTHSLEDALSLSTDVFSTIGYGDLAFDPAWRLLTALEGINGFLMIGWSTAYLVRASTLHGPFRVEHF
jgi:hypothetical protein